MVNLLEAPEGTQRPRIPSVFRVIGAPVRTFQIEATQPRPVGAFAMVVSLTVATALISAPVVRRLLQEAPDLGASADVLSRLVTLQAIVFAPVGTTAFLCFTALFMWCGVLIMGHDVSLKQVAAIAFTAAMAGVLKRVFVVGVLYLRWWLNPAVLAANVTTGLDGFLDPEQIGRVPTLLLAQLGLFEVWFAVLLTMGLRYGTALSPRRAWIAPAALLAVMTATRFFIAWMRGG